MSTRQLTNQEKEIIRRNGFGFMIEVYEDSDTNRHNALVDEQSLGEVFILLKKCVPHVPEELVKEIRAYQHQSSWTIAKAEADAEIVAACANLMECSLDEGGWEDNSSDFEQVAQAESKKRKLNELWQVYTKTS